MTAETRDREAHVPTPTLPPAPVATAAPPPPPSLPPLAGHLAGQPLTPPSLLDTDAVVAPSLPPPAEPVAPPALAPAVAPALPAPNAAPGDARDSAAGPDPHAAPLSFGAPAGPPAVEHPPLPVPPPPPTLPASAAAGSLPEVELATPVVSTPDPELMPKPPPSAALPAPPPPPLPPTAVVPPPEPHTAGTPPSGDATPDPGGPLRRPRRRLVVALVVLVVLAGLAAAGWVGYQRFLGDDAERAPEPATEPDTDPDTAAAGDASTEPPPADGEPDTIFGEAQQLVDEINADPGVAEALEELGLDATGNPVPPQAGDEPAGSATTAPPASYGFRWTDPFGLTVAVQVDTATGNYLATTGDGTEIRRVDGRYFGLAENSSWIELSPDVVSGVPVIGIDGLLDGDHVLPEGIDRFVVASEVTGSGTVRLLIDDTSLAAEDPELRDRWLGPWGIVETEPPAAEVPPADVVPPTASDGQVVVSIVHSDDGWLSEVVVSSPAIGGSATYSLSSTALFPLEVVIPAELAGG